MTGTCGIGIIGGGYMGKAHAVAYAAVGALFELDLRPRLEMICTTTEQGAKDKAHKFGFARSTSDWTSLVDDPKVDAVIIASPQDTHKQIALRAFELGKPVFCEKPLGSGLAEAQAMTNAAEAANAINMIGFNYVRTPATQLARQIIESGEIGDITHFRGEHTEDFYADPNAPASWRTQGRNNGTMGDLAPHMINGALALAGPMVQVSADIQTVHTLRPGKNGPEDVTNDDVAQMMCRFENGAMGLLHFSRIATGRKMGYAYEVFGTKGAIRFDQEDQNSLWLCETAAPKDRSGFKRILTGPEHPDYAAFCQGAGHGTGYQDQIIIEAKDFLKSIEQKANLWPTFRDGLAVSKVVEACWASLEQRSWVSINDV